MPDVMKRANAALAVRARRARRSARRPARAPRARAVAAPARPRARRPAPGPRRRACGTRWSRGPRASPDRGYGSRTPVCRSARWHDGHGVGISTETREHAVAPVREQLMALIAERRPGDADALREFAADVPAPPLGRRRRGDVARGAARRGRRRVRLRRRAAATGRSSCARSTRPPRSTATSAPARVLETTSEDLPFLVDSRARGESPREGLDRAARAAPGRRAGARRGRPHHRRRAPARGDLARVGHALRPRPPARARRSSRRSPTPSSRCSATCAARCSTSRRWPTAAGAWCSSPAPGAARYAGRRGRRDRRVPRVAARRPLHLPRLPRVQDRGRRDRPRARLGARHPRRRGVVGVRAAAAARRAARRTCASARSRATC